MVRIDLDALHREAAAYFRDICKALEPVEQKRAGVLRHRVVASKRGLRIGVLTVPGVIALKRIPSFANSIADARVTDFKLPLVRFARLAGRRSVGSIATLSFLENTPSERYRALVVS